MASSVVSHSHGGQHQQHLPAAAGSMMARVDRLDLVVGYLEEMRHHSGGSGRSSTTATSTLSSSSPTTPRSRPHGCRPAEELLRETKAKGSLVERIAFLEDRVLRMEEERMELLSSSVDTAEQTTPTSSGRRTMRMMMSGSGGAGDGHGSPGSGKKGKKGLKSLVKSCVRAGAKLKTKE